MKTKILLLWVLWLATLFLRAEDPKGPPTMVEFQTTRPQKEQKKAPVTPAKPTGEILGNKVFYGGFFTEFLRAENKRPFLNLKTPINPDKDFENLWFSPGTDKIQGTVLFSIKF